MDNDLIPILGIVLLGGFAVWWIMRKPAVPVEPPKPCMVSGSYQGTGLSLPCETLKPIGDAIKNIVALPSKVLSMVPGTGGPTMAPLEKQIEFANQNGIIFGSSTPGSWNVTKGVKLPPGQKNALSSDGKPILVNMDGSPIVWKAVPPVRSDAPPVPRPPSTVPIGSAPQWRG